MDTNTKTAEQRFEDSYRQQPAPKQTSTAPPMRDGASAEEKLAGNYARPEQPQKQQETAPGKRPPMTAEERLAAAYGRDDEGNGDDGGDNAAENNEQEENGDAKPEGQKLTAPEGFTIDETTAKELGALATEMKLAPGAMQELVTKTAPLLKQRTDRFIAATMETWARETYEDEQVGGEKFEQSMREANKALRAFGSGELRKLIGPPSAGGSGIANNRHFVRFLARVGRELG